MVIGRSGYSTIMDLVAMKKKAILIPTPGQTEQEYLARYLHNVGLFLRSQQRNFSIDASVKQATAFPFHPFAVGDSFSIYRQVLDVWLGGI
jgi:UDP-N-acetylglucosamine:LPS N-acetylglucosamine transferase